MKSEHRECMEALARVINELDKKFVEEGLGRGNKTLLHLKQLYLLQNHIGFHKFSKFERNYFIFINSLDEFEIGHTQNINALGTVYMTLKEATRVIKLLRGDTNAG